MRKFYLSPEVCDALDVQLSIHEFDKNKVLEEHLWRISKGGGYTEDLSYLNEINMLHMTLILHLGYERLPTEEEVVESLNHYKELIEGLEELEWDYHSQAITALKRIITKTGI